MKIVNFGEPYDEVDKQGLGWSVIAGQLVKGDMEFLNPQTTALDILSIDCELVSESRVLMPITISFDGTFDVSPTLENEYHFSSREVIPSTFQDLIPSGLFIRLQAAEPGSMVTTEQRAELGHEEAKAYIEKRMEDLMQHLEQS